MDTNRAMSIGARLALSEPGQALFIDVLDYRNYTHGLVAVEEHHKQALALVAKGTCLPAYRHKLMHNEWFADYTGTSESGGDGVSCWISRKGMVFMIQYAGHSSFAELIGLDGRTTVLERAGWIHVSGGRADIMYPVTAMQRKAIDALAAKYGLKEKEVSSSHPMQTDEILSKLDRVPRSNFVPDANFWADEHKEKSDAS